MFAPCLRVASSSLVAISVAAFLAGAGPQAGEEPEVALRNFHGGVYKGGSRHYVLWSSRGEAALKSPVSVEVSMDQGVQWEVIAKGLPNTGRYLWALPEENGPSYRLRVTVSVEGGRMISSVSSADFGIDMEAPDAVPYCKSRGETTVNVEKAQAEIRIDLPPDAGPAPVVKLEVWATTDGGITWKELARGRPGDRSIPIRVTPGETGIILVAQDAAGNRDDAPTAGSTAELVLVWKAEDVPKGELPAAAKKEPPFSGIEAEETYRGGTSVSLRWNPPIHYQGGSARIEILVEGNKKWQDLTKGQPVPWNGPANVILPSMNSKATQIRVVVDPKEEGADPWVETVGPFTLQMPPPKAKIKEIEKE